MTIATGRTIPALWRQSGTRDAGPAPRPSGGAGQRRRGPLAPLFDRLIAASSLVATDPVLDMRAFAWTALLRDHWRTIRDEAAHGGALVLWRHGRALAPQRCPQTQRLLAAIPGLDTAAISILPPGAHVPAHRGATKALVTCHLGLIVPRDGDVRMRVGDRVMRWAEGETLVFDDTYDHALWNEATGDRIVLLLRVARPLRNPGRWVADAVLRVGG